MVRTVRLKHPSADCRRLLTRASGIIVINVIDDPAYAVLADD